MGQRGEDYAARHLRRNGYKVLYRNFRSSRGGEVDLVCRDRKAEMLVFVEVKTRSSREYGDPSLAVTPEKQRLLIRGAYAWLRLLRRDDVPFRFDIVEVVIEDGGPTINLIRNAFEAAEGTRR